MTRRKVENPAKYVRLSVRFLEHDFPLVHQAATNERLSMNAWMVRILLAVAREAAAARTTPATPARKLRRA